MIIIMIIIAIFEVIILIVIFTNLLIDLQYESRSYL